MKNVIHMLEYIGINIAIFIVGFIGAVFMAGKQKGMSVWERLLTILGGAFTANYITPIVEEQFDISQRMIYGAAFALGYSGLKTLELIIRSFHTKIDDTNETL